MKMFDFFKREKVPDLTISELVESRGFALEEHHVVTNDGFILTVHRLLDPKRDYSISDDNFKPILLQHGLFSNSYHWLMNDSKEEVPQDLNHLDKTVTSNALGFALIKTGRHDVWLANSRGNQYSQTHKLLDISDSQFWDFCWDEMIQFDLPQTIDHILHATGKKSLGLIAHSQGTTITFGLLSTQPKYNQLISPFIALAPLVRYTNATSPLRFAPSVVCFFARGNGRIINSNSFSFLHNTFIEKVIHHIGLFCCFSVIGFNYEQVNWKRLGVHFRRVIGETSWKVFRQHNQHFLRDTFRKYDYGKKTNFTIYGEDMPPEYDLKKITCKSISFVRGANDLVVDERDVAYIRDNLNVPLKHDEVLSHNKWTHTDFLLAKDAGKLLNEKLIDMLEGANV